MEKNSNTNNPLVSVIIPSYNHAAFVKEAVLSVIHQTYENIELIVIDDGSKDNSKEILEELQQQYNFILKFQTNQGLSKTLNKAIREYAHGKYIACLASDDYWTEDKTAKQANYLEAHSEYGMVFGNSIAVDAQGVELPKIKSINSTRLFSTESVTFESLIENNYIPATATLYKKSVWEQCGGFNENSIIEDWDLWLKIAYNNKIAYQNETVTYYRWHGNNISAKTLPIYQAMWKIVQTWKDKMEPPFAKKILARRDSITFNVLARKYKRESWRYLTFNGYMDMFMVLNYLKGFFKLLFIW